MAQPLLVTAALPYANGPIHLGHIVEHVQTDVFVRAQRSLGREAVFLCADDTHGTPIEVSARRQNISPEDLVARFAVEHRRDFADFQVEHATYGSTNSPENRKYAELIFERLKAGGHVHKRPVEQFFCESDQRFLPDRFIRGVCPNCKTPDQYGDVCESCGKTYAPTELIDPRCALCGRPPVRRSSDHYFVALSGFTAFLKGFTDSGALDPAVRNGLQKWFEQGLADWDVSRDGPYFGFKIPGESDKYFYVWLDAPIGYISTTELWCGDASKYWDPKADAEIVHVIGKDIVYFHTLFWPAMLSGAGFKVPSRITVHGMLTMNGEKMSKTRGTFINARDYLDKLDPAYLRYFLASNLGPSPEDIDLSLDEFRNRVNAELVNNIGNLCNRALKMIAANFGGRLSDQREPADAPLSHARELVRRAAGHYERFELRDAVKCATEMGDWANKYLADRAPWNALKSGEARAKEQAHRDLSFAAEVSYLLGAVLHPVVPRLMEQLFTQLNAPPLTLARALEGAGPLLPMGHAIGEPRPLIPRLEAKQVDALVQASPGGAPPPTAATPAAKPADASTSRRTGSAIGIDDFAKVDIRVGKVLSCEKVAASDKLLKLSVDVGEPAPRTILSGIARFHEPASLQGRSILVVVNLAPKEFKKLGEVSHGMVLSASTGSGAEERLAALEAPAGLPPGSRVG